MDMAAQRFPYKSKFMVT